MALRTRHGVNVVTAVGPGIARIHLINVQPAIRKPGMAIGARPANLHRVRRVAGQAAQPFMDSTRGPIVASAGLMICGRRVTLIAQALPRIGGHGDHALAVVD